MLEQARFSLARAGVMVGLCSLVVLGAGWVMNSRDGVKNKASLHFSARTWEDVQWVLRYVTPLASPIETTMSELSGPGCAAGRPGHERLRKAVETLNQNLERATKAAEDVLQIAAGHIFQTHFAALQVDCTTFI